MTALSGILGISIFAKAFFFSITSTLNQFSIGPGVGIVAGAYFFKTPLTPYLTLGFDTYQLPIPEGKISSTGFTSTIGLAFLSKPKTILTNYSLITKIGLKISYGLIGSIYLNKYNHSYAFGYYTNLISYYVLSSLGINLNGLIISLNTEVGLSQAIKEVKSRVLKQPPLRISKIGLSVGYKYTILK